MKATPTITQHSYEFIHELLNNFMNSVTISCLEAATLFMKVFKFMSF